MAQLKGQGRQKLTDERAERTIVRDSLSNRRLTSPELCRIYNLGKGRTISSRTIRRILQKYGLRGCIAVKKPLLSKANKAKRWHFAKRYRHWDSKRWRNVLFSDESSFELFSSKYRIHVRRRSTEKFKDECLQPTVKHGGGTIMVWGCMSWYGLGMPLRVLQGSVNKEVYLDILKTTMLPAARSIGFPNNKFIFQEDNAPVHTAKIVQAWIKQQEFPRLSWPPQSPDMSPIETLWNDMKAIMRNTKPRNKGELVNLIQDTWNNFPKAKLEKLIDSMPKRLNDLYRAKGGHTRW